MTIRRRVTQVVATRQGEGSTKAVVRRETVVVAQRFGVVNITRGASAYREELTISSNGQTAFNLAHISTAPHLSQVALNGVIQRLGSDYIINSSVLTWVSSIPVATSDFLTIYYS